MSRPIRKPSAMATLPATGNSTVRGSPSAGGSYNRNFAAAEQQCFAGVYSGPRLPDKSKGNQGRKSSQNDAEPHTENIGVFKSAQAQQGNDNQRAGGGQPVVDG